jgi:hypothetical protein
MVAICAILRQKTLIFQTLVGMTTMENLVEYLYKGEDPNKEKHFWKFTFLKNLGETSLIQQQLNLFQAYIQLELQVEKKYFIVVPVPK